MKRGFLISEKNREKRDNPALGTTLSHPREKQKQDAALVKTVLLALVRDRGVLLFWWFYLTELHSARSFTDTQTME